jgi:hypothetical protein
MEVSMRTFRQLLVALLVVVTALSPVTFAQERHVIDSAAMAGAVSQHAARQDAGRATVREALNRPEVRQVAEKIGIDLARLNAAVETLSGADLERAAGAARQVNDSLVGGASTIVISTTTIIIALLLIILIVLIA